MRKYNHISQQFKMYSAKFADKKSAPTAKRGSCGDNHELINSKRLN